MSADTWTDIRDVIVAEIGGIADIGNVVVRQALPKDWVSYLNTFAVTISGTKQIRGWLVLPDHPFRNTTVEAIGGHFQDVYNFTVIGFQSAQDTDASFKESLDRAIQVTDALDARQNYGLSTGDTIFYAGPAQIRSHEFRMFGNVGVWYTDIQFDVTVNRAQVTYD